MLGTFARTKTNGLRSRFPLPVCAFADMRPRIPGKLQQAPRSRGLTWPALQRAVQRGHNQPAVAIIVVAAGTGADMTKIADHALPGDDGRPA